MFFSSLFYRATHSQKATKAIYKVGASALFRVFARAIPFYSVPFNFLARTGAPRIFLAINNGFFAAYVTNFISADRRTAAINNGFFAAYATEPAPFFWHAFFA